MHDRVNDDCYWSTLFIILEVNVYTSNSLSRLRTTKVQVY